MLTFRIGDGHTGLREGTTEENGLVRVDAGALLEVWGGTVRFEDIGLFAATRGELGSTIPDLQSFKEGIQPVPFIPVDRGRRGIVDPDDYLLLYATGSSDWWYDSVGGQFRFSVDRYDDYRTYWLVYRPGSGVGTGIMQRFVQPQENGIAQHTFENRLFLKRSLKMPADGREGTADWVWGCAPGRFGAN